jgi:REP element-mobilizing transposase RayT
MLQDGFFEPASWAEVRWGDLPHWRQDGALYFVTFRLADSLPRGLLNRWRKERDEWRRRHPNPGKEELEEFSRRHRGMIERWLDRGVGSCILESSRARHIMEEEMRSGEGERYELGEFVVAGNHVHANVRTLPGVDLSDVLRLWKGRAARRILACQDEVNLRGRKLWQRESFDHIVRNQASLDRFTGYIRNHR